ncbi:MAG: hypothetical protein JWQ63_4063 [Mucilaginibacter sp.]|nr:hypothetical protein [Mucilaginibacter sp.]
MSKKLKLLINILALLVTFSINAHAQTNNDQIEITPIEGIKIFTPNKYSIQGKIWGGELAYRFNMNNNKLDYVKLLGLNSIDIVASYRNLQSLIINNDPASKGSLGDAYSVIGRLEMQLFKAGPVKLLFTPGVGVTYSTESYFTNKNPLIGSKINIAEQAGIKIFSSITSSTGIQVGADLFHYSNGGERLPNNGINSLNISFGIVQNINKTGPSTPREPFQYNYTNSLEFGVDFGERSVFASKQPLYRSGVYAGYSYRLNPVFSLKGGFDAGYFFTVFDPANYDITHEGNATSYDHWRLGASLGAETRLGRLAVFASYGYYLYYHSYVPVKTYWTPAVKYYLSSWMAVQAKTYINNHTADYLGVGLLFRVY